MNMKSIRKPLATTSRLPRGAKSTIALLMLVVMAGGAMPTFAQQTKTTVTYVYTNAQGTPIAEADAQGNIIARYTYRPYGTQQSGPTNAGPGYTGHVHDPDTGLVYMQQRYYNPVVGRFISPDPVAPKPGNVFNFGRYTYANGNPIMNIDPFGAYTCNDNSGVKGNSYCSKIESGYDRLVQASHNTSMSAPVHAFLVKLVKKLGKPGDPSTGVVIHTGGYTVNGKNVLGGTRVNTQTGVTDIGLQMQRFSNRFSWQSGSDFINHLGGILAHEGTHMLGQFVNGLPKSGLEEFGDEERAYTMEAYYQKAIGYSGAPQLWNPYTGISTTGINNGAASSTSSWCGGLGASCSTKLLNRLKQP